MANYTHSLAFTVRARETVGVDRLIAPEIDSNGVFQASADEEVLQSLDGAKISFSRMKIIKIPDGASPRQRARLERKMERQQWEHLGKLKHASFLVTSSRLVWIAKHRADMWVGFSPAGLVKAAAKTAVSSARAAGKWDIGQVVLTMVGSVAADGNKHVIFTFADSETRFRVDVEKVRNAREFVGLIHERSVPLIRRAYEQYSSHQSDAILALREYEALEDASRRQGSVVSYMVPYVCHAPFMPSLSGSDSSGTAVPTPVDTLDRKQELSNVPQATGMSKRKRSRLSVGFRRFVKAISPPIVMAIVIIERLYAYRNFSFSPKYLTTSVLCVVVAGVLAGLIVSWLLSLIWIRRGALTFLGYAALGFAAWEEWGNLWFAPLQWTYELSRQVQYAPLEIVYVLRIDTQLTFALFMMAVAWGLLLRRGD